MQRSKPFKATSQSLTRTHNLKVLLARCRLMLNVRCEGRGLSSNQPADEMSSHPTKTNTGHFYATPLRRVASVVHRRHFIPKIITSIDLQASSGKRETLKVNREQGKGVREFGLALLDTRSTISSPDSQPTLPPLETAN